MPIGVPTFSRHKGLDLSHLVKALNIIGCWEVAHEVLTQLVIEALHVKLVEFLARAEVQACLLVDVHRVRVLRGRVWLAVNSRFDRLIFGLIPNVNLFTRCITQHLQDIEIEHLVLNDLFESELGAASDNQRLLTIDSIKELLLSEREDHCLKQVMLVDRVESLWNFGQFSHNASLLTDGAEYSLCVLVVWIVNSPDFNTRMRINQFIQQNLRCLFTYLLQSLSFLSSITFNSLGPECLST